MYYCVLKWSSINLKLNWCLPWMTAERKCVCKCSRSHLVMCLERTVNVCVCVCVERLWVGPVRSVSLSGQIWHTPFHLLFQTACHHTDITCDNRFFFCHCFHTELQEPSTALMYVLWMSPVLFCTTIKHVHTRSKKKKKWLTVAKQSPTALWSVERGIKRWFISVHNQFKGFNYGRKCREIWGELHQSRSAYLSGALFTLWKQLYNFIFFFKSEKITLMASLWCLILGFGITDI